MNEILLFALVGFLAQMVDGMLGMAYGVTSTTFLLAFGVSPAIASASVHFAKVITTGISAVSHHAFSNVDRSLVKRLLIPGVVGAILGVYILVNVPGERIKPFVAAYLLIMGIVILIKARKQPAHREVTTHLGGLGLMGGFFDAIGGGGWGPIVTGTLLARGNLPRTAIGSVNFAEFFVSLSAAATFLLAIGFTSWRPVAGLAIGGAIAAPFAAWACRLVRPRPMLIAVGCLIIILSIRTIFLALR